MSNENENTQDNKPLTRSQMILLRVMKNRQEAKEIKEAQDKKLQWLKEARKEALEEMESEQPTYLTEAHQKNSEAVMKEIAESKKSPTDWEQESKRQKWNSQDHSQDTN